MSIIILWIVYHTDMCRHGSQSATNVDITVSAEIWVTLTHKNSYNQLKIDSFTSYPVEQQKFQVFLRIGLSNAVCSEMENTHTVLQMCPETDVTACAKERPTDYSWLDWDSR